MLKISSDARKASLDIRLVRPGDEEWPDSKVNRCVENTVRVHRETEEERGTQRHGRWWLVIPTYSSVSAAE